MVSFAPKSAAETIGCQHSQPRISSVRWTWSGNVPPPACSIEAKPCTFSTGTSLGRTRETTFKCASISRLWGSSRFRLPFVVNPWQGGPPRTMSATPERLAILFAWQSRKLQISIRLHRQPSGPALCCFDVDKVLPVGFDCVSVAFDGEDRADARLRDA